MSNNYPLPAYHFLVEWGGTRVGFSEVSGLNISVDVNEYREGSDPEYHTRKMPGLSKFSNITLKRGVIKNDNDFFNWINKVVFNQPERRDIIIKLLNELHEPVVTWKVQNAFPVKYTGPTLIAHSTNIAIEELEITHEGLSIIV